MLGLYELTNLLFYIFLVISIITALHQPLALYITLGIALVRIISMYVVLGISAKKLEEKQVIPNFLFYDILFSVLNPLYWLSAKFNHKILAK